ncbi:MAG: sodium/solute symporter [Sedimentisphaerales bacterium]|nr:sodium/solute symporter [Sedimentisphaerales bacterium]
MKQTMQPLDWVVIGVYGIGMLIIGWYFSRRTKTSEDYMLGGRQMRSWMVGMSLFASLLSAVSYLAWPGEMLHYGPMLFCQTLSHPLTFIVVGWFLIPAFMRTRVSSAYELLEIRLGPSVRILASILFLTMRLIWMGVIIYVSAVKVIVPIMGWSDEAAIWVSIVMGVITIIYTSMGGLRAVVLTDVIQTFILFSAAIGAIILITSDLGSVTAWIPKKWPDGWLGWTFFDTKVRVSFLTTFISGFSWWVCTAGSDQMAVQRYLATRDAKTARKTLLTSLICDATVGLFLAIIGLALLAYFQVHANLLPEGQTITSYADRLFPHFIVTALPAGITGLVIAGLLAAAMSSLSSGINSSSLVISRDFISRFSKKEIAESAQVKLNKIISVGIGVIFVLLSLLVSKVKGNLVEVSSKTVNLLVAPLFVPFFMALFIRRATAFGTFIGTIVSIVVAVSIGFSSELFGRYVTFLWIMPGSFIAGIFVSTVLSFFRQVKK